MKFIYLIFYNLFLALYAFFTRLLAPWNRKAALWLKGRKGLFAQIAAKLEKAPPQRVWIHCASLGEFEQARPVLEAIRKQYPDLFIILSFFSPSGYEVRKNYEQAHLVTYLPLDSRRRSRQVLQLFRPQLVIWTKYDYWYYYLQAIRSEGIPLLLLSADFKRNMSFFHWYGGLQRIMLQCFSHLFVQNDLSARLIKTLGLGDRVTVSGDTRFDRVQQAFREFAPLPLVESFCGQHRVLVAGSTWPEDIEELDHYANTHPDIRFIVAPHEIEENQLRAAEELFAHPIRYSQLAQAEGSGPKEANVLIIDNIGMLSKLYYYAHITYIGGGFGHSGIHNALEAAVYGKPVVFGPVYEQYNEAVGLVNVGGAFPIESTLELESLLDDLWNNPGRYEEASRASAEYVRRHTGATEKVMRYIQENRLLTMR